MKALTRLTPSPMMAIKTVNSLSHYTDWGIAHVHSGALGWVVALPLSMPMSAALSSAFGEVMFSVPVRALPSLRGALYWLLLAAIVSLVACAMPARRATRVSVAAALSYE